MFTSTTSLNPFISSSSSSSSSHVDLSPYIYHHHHEPDHNTFLLHHNQIQNPLSILPLISTDHHHSNNSMSSKQELIQITDGDFLHQFGLNGNSSVSLAEKRPPKKDRHSKIITAQGLRDRRVRISIEIARKFFDLQDLLGLDKASKTLEWLLNKSRKAIKALAQDDNSLNNNNNSSDSTCEEAKEEEEKEEEDNVISKMMKKKKKKSAVALSNLQITAKQLREKARARARERTRIKLLCNAKFNDSIMNLYHQKPSFSSPCNQISSFPSSKVVGEVPYNGISSTIGESILMKRKLKQSTMMGYQQNLFLMKDVSNCNNFPNLVPPNWDNNNNGRSSSLCAITRAHLLHGKISEADQSSKWL